MKLKIKESRLRFLEYVDDDWCFWVYNSNDLNNSHFDRIENSESDRYTINDVKVIKLYPNDEYPNDLTGNLVPVQDVSAYGEYDAVFCSKEDAYKHLMNDLNNKLDEKRDMIEHPEFYKKPRKTRKRSIRKESRSKLYKEDFPVCPYVNDDYCDADIIYGYHFYNSMTDEDFFLIGHYEDKVKRYGNELADIYDGNPDEIEERLDKFYYNLPKYLSVTDPENDICEYQRLTKSWIIEMDNGYGETYEVIVVGEFKGRF